MLHQRNRLSLQSPLRPLSVLGFFVLLTHSVTGQSLLISPPQPIVATVGDDIILPCHLEPAVDVAAKTLEWTRTDLNSTVVFVWRADQDLVNKHPSYEGRISLFTEELQRGNISLKLSKVKPSDGGRYRCFIPHKEIVAYGSFVELVVGAVSSPVITLGGIDKATSGVVLQCESAGWYPGPEVLWLDGEGNLLSAGPTETVRGPDDLYTVSSRVTVEKRHSNSFTCRVQQNNINQTRETHISVSDDFFQVQSTYSSITTGLAVGLTVCVLLILLLFFVLWKWRQSITKTKRGHTEEEVEPLKGKVKKESKHEEQQRREEAERQVQALKKELETKKTEYESKLAEVQRQLQSLKEELETKNRELEESKAAQSLSLFNLTITTKQTLENEQQRREGAEKQVQELRQELDDKNKALQEEQQRREEAEKRVKTLEEKLQTKKSEAQKHRVLPAGQQNTTQSDKMSFKFKKQKPKQHLQQQQSMQEAEKEVQTPVGSGVVIVDETEDNQAEVQQLQDENQRMENNQQTMNQKQENNQQPSAGDNNEDLPEINDQDHYLTSRANQDSAKRHITVDEVDVEGGYVHLSNNSEEDQPMGDWELHIRIISRKPIVYHFKPSFILKAGKTVTIWASGCGVSFETSSILVWSSQTSWGTGKQLLVTIYSNTGELQTNKMLELGSSHKYQEKVICMTSRDSATGPITVDEVDLKGEYVRLSNTSNEDQPLEGWELHIQVNNRKPIVYKFSSFIVKAGNTVTIWSSDHSDRNNPPTDLVWQNQTSWGTGEELLVTIYNNTGEEMATKLKTPNISEE